MKFTLKSKDYTHQQILLDDKDISDRVVGAEINISAGCVPTVALELRPDNIEVDGDFDIFKDVPKLCCVGDYGNTEMVQSANNTDWILNLSKKIAQECYKNIDTNNNVVVHIDEETISKAIINNFKRKV
ncbi:hypothetical protein LF65_02275 [Clostridium beijerinckii]|uniref:Uncharacterized protein n=1 Tax=Clostridium beijerinckii TaxID=1520 RepID=A0A0B5QKU9_CLOBE|nr:hypothetical protein [Clostridium beijerinckii]AJG98861.1 hypothetical protein LF65_02275 [Clostridium beijerinckii]